MEISTEIPKEPSNPPNSNKRNKTLFIVSICILFLGLSYLSYWYFYGRIHEYTNDAYVDGNTITVNATVPGIITKIYVQDTDYVLKGTPLIELDTTEYEIELERCKETLADKVRDVARLFSEAALQQAEIENKKATFIKYTEDYQRRVELVKSGSVSKEDFDHSVCDMAAAYAALISTEQAFFGTMAQIDNTTIESHPKVDIAKQQLKKAWVELKRCTIYAPTDGLVAQKSAQVGKWTGTTHSLLSIVPLDQMWITANFKETQLARMRVGQAVSVKSDIYGSSVKYQGTVTGVAGGTGSAFSIIPAQNATGNWIKIVQRVPVRIDLPTDELKKYPLRIGLSMFATVNTKKTKGAMTPIARTDDTPRFYTGIFDQDEEGVDQVIEDIILSNMSSYSMELEDDDESDSDS
ncbi:MAG: HlyD family efflux transporter periplasmic adaptor subunit [Chlamydiae bacterium]|nr:HlyD family efflux transporter periplasmic adaptor subunit [Chlamydiota bacterium]